MFFPNVLHFHKWHHYLPSCSSQKPRAIFNFFFLSSYSIHIPNPSIKSASKYILGLLFLSLSAVSIILERLHRPHWTHCKSIFSGFPASTLILLSIVHRADNVIFKKKKGHIMSLPCLNPPVSSNTLRIKPRLLSRAPAYLRDLFSSPFPSLTGL